MGILDLPSNIASAVVDPLESIIESPFSIGVKNRDLPADFPAGFQIVEILNGAPDTLNLVKLMGNMLPKVPFEFGGEQRLAKEYYPGNPEPAVQVLGPKESEVTITGTFKDKRYRTKGPDKVPYGASYAIVTRMDEIRRRGNLLQIRLGTWSRYAFLEKTEFKLNKLSWIDYSMTFFIVGEDMPTNCKLVAKNKEIPFSQNAALLAEMQDFQSRYSTIPSSMPRSLADLINQVVGAVAAAVAVVTGFVNELTNIEDIDRALHRAIGVIKNARTNLIQFRRRLGIITYDYDHIAKEKNAALNFKSALRNTAHIQNAVSATNNLSQLLAKLEAQFNAISNTTPLARYKVKSGDTLQKIALKFYGDAGNWNKIYDHNKLTTTLLTLGSLLEIPRA